MTTKTQNLNLIIETGTRELEFSLPAPAGTFTAGSAMTISNTGRAPRCSVNGAPPVLLRKREAEMIDKLLDVCTHYDDQGDPQLSGLVDRIGMTLMKAYLERAQDAPKPKPRGLRITDDVL